MSISHKHHYIPKFYLKGFINESGKFFVFDKSKEIISTKYPSNSFFSQDRNTIKIGEEQLTFIEDVYSRFENRIAPHLKKIRNVDNLDEISHKAFVEILRFIHILYWRLPGNDKKIEELIDKMSFEECGFGMIDEKTNKFVNKEIQAQLKGIDAYRKLYQHFLPFLSLNKEYRKENIDDWRIYKRNGNCNFTSDNPLILDKFIDFGSLNEEIIMPLSSNKILLHTKKPKPNSLPPEFSLHVDLLLLQQAKKYVCCPDKIYLEEIVDKLYSVTKNYEWENEIKDKIFSYFVG